MKKKLLIYYCFLVPIIIIPIKAHDNQDVHQRIVIEAYKLLKIQLSKENGGIADIENYIGEVKYFNPQYDRSK